MIIDQLPALVTAGDNDEIAIEVGTTTYKITKSNFLKEFMPKSGGEFTGDVAVGGVLDVTQRRCYGTLSSAGWYRVCAIRYNSYGEAVGALGGILRFAITDSYASYPNDAHTIDLLIAHNNVTFVNEASAANGYLEIDKIRYTFTGTSPYNGYVDIHFLGRGGTTYVGISFDYTGIGLDRQERVVAQNLQSVAASPSGETVLTEYTFAANTRSLLNTNIFRIRQSYSNITVGSNGYVLLDSFANMGVSSQNYCLGFNVVGWSRFPTYGFQIMIGSNGTDFYFASSVAGTFGSFTVEYWFADLA